MPIRAWAGANFTGQNRVRAPHSSIVCEPCVWAMQGRPPDALRMMSHFFDDRGWLQLNKGDKAKMRAWLRYPKRGAWFAAIADSGQKQLLPWTPINPPGSAGRVYFEETTIAGPDAASFELVDAMAALLTEGATKDEIGTGRYGARAWDLCAGLRAFETRWSHARTGSWFGLALWLAQRDEEAVAARLAAEKEAKAAAKSAAKEKANAQRGAARKDPNANRGVPARGANCVPQGGRQPAEALGADHESDAVGGEAQRNGGRVEHESAPGPGPGAPRQLGLPGFT
jgi:hypothetical protein